jgi:hypothetical protein
MTARLLSLVSASFIALSGCAGPAYIRMDDVKNAGSYEGRGISFSGKKSNIQWQHIIMYFKTHPHVSYIDTGGTQFVVYSREEINCGGTVTVKGRVFTAENKPVKDENVKCLREYQVMADEFSCEQ